jgi:hypothetical protein
MIVKCLQSADQARNHASDGWATNGGGVTNISSIFAATFQIGGKKDVTDIEQILTAALFVVHAYSMNIKFLTILRDYK